MDELYFGTYVPKESRLEPLSFSVGYTIYLFSDPEKLKFNSPNLMRYNLSHDQLIGFLEGISVGKSKEDIIFYNGSVKNNNDFFRKQNYYLHPIRKDYLKIILGPLENMEFIIKR